MIRRGPRIAGWNFVHNDACRGRTSREVVIAEAPQADLPEVRAMLEEYATWPGIDLSFQGLAGELNSLPGSYCPPAGGLFVARLGHAVVGWWPSAAVKPIQLK